MSDAHRPLLTAIVATPDCGAACLFSMLEILSAVGRDWEILHGRPPGPVRFDPRLVSVDGAPFDGPNGVRITPHYSLADCPAPDIVLAPDLIVSQSEPLPAAYDPFSNWMVAAYDRGALLASVCSGALLLARTGLLDGGEATTHWAFCDGLARQYPAIKVRGERALVAAGPEQRILTAGGASAWNDLLLHLVARFAGPEEAVRISKVFLLQGHLDGQAPYAAFSAGRQHEDRVVAECQQWAAEHYACENPVAAMAEHSGLAERSLHRRFRQATGLSPLAYVQALRIEEAKHMLETTDLPIDEVGAEVGYFEPASFRRLFRREVGVTPSAYRRRFRPLFRLAG